jgi:hypothetical protein
MCQGKIAMKVLVIILAAIFLVQSPLLLAQDKKEKAKKEEAGSTRVYRFDNLDIDGHVKTPQLMYFLKRIKNKFRAFRIPKQNFKKRIIKSKDAEFLH